MLKQLSNRVSAKTIEETYTDNDVEHVMENKKPTTDISAGYNPTTGFTFDYPMRWLNDQSEYKAIGIRRLKVVPTSHVLALNIYIKYQLTDDSQIVSLTPVYVPLSVTSENNFEEIIHNIIDGLNSFLENNKPENDKLFVFTYQFDYRTGDFSLSLTCPDEIELLQFSIQGDSYSTLAENNLNFFLKFLNQERTDENRQYLIDDSDSKTFHNVWDRSSLQFHASFSDNRRGFIGLNNDFYENPSVFYDPPTNSSNFWIRFTTDGVHQILPRYCRFYIGLCYVRNYKNSLVTK